MKKVLRILTAIVLFTLATATSFGEEWYFEVNPSDIRMYSTEGLKRPSWFRETYELTNFVNLSFFTSKTFIPPYKDSLRSVMVNKKEWPVFVIDSNGLPSIYQSDRFKEMLDSDLKFVASGYPVLLENGNKSHIKNTYFSKRRCARTAIGIHPNGSVIVYVSTAATLKDVQEFFWSIGCVDAINFDGGSSTFLIVDGKTIYSTKKGHSYPNVLSWK